MKLTKKEFLKLNPCQDALEFAKECEFDAVKGWKTCERGDWLIWLLRNTDKLDKSQAVKIAIACSKHVLHLFEKKYPDDKRPRQAIESAIAWVKDPTEENRNKAKFAASDAAYTAYTAYTAANAANAAAYTAANAANAASDAAYTAYTAANAAYTAAGAAAYTAANAAYNAYTDADYSRRQKSERKWQADKIREIVPCPFKN